MKKLLLTAFLVLGIQSLSCEFMNNPDVLLGRIITKIKQGKKTQDIFCDSEEIKMAYYLVENGDYNLNIGINIGIGEQTTNNDFKNDFYKKLSEYTELLKTVDRKNLNGLPLPDKEVLRFFGQIQPNKNFFFIGKYEYDRKTDKYKMIVNLKGKQIFEQMGLFNGIQVEYSDEIIF
ncbi:hypothetical protein EII29_00185 [Leptotrichia sp. OH3620_COT-345]|uniref:hypothetical protein n=1 Tax=Leptotrichia sp. OH3620_COT-345 TaxID=2491048 RepID=UPI000F64BE06|nr:hypothetical protein [Leptotrichia sp. OH3620_COT-345]RRD40906.1 hypothetical protein EII29_00185 [Leptotrichia sp. OH3620_COT-345]